VTGQTDGTTSQRTLADKINHLFASVRPGSGEREYTGREVVAAVRAAGTDLSASHLSELRRGVKSNPTMRVLEGLARFFDVRVAYFLDDPQIADEVESEIELRKAMNDTEVRDIAARAAGLDPAQRGAMNRLLADLLREQAADSTGG
jgi:transcriptional regulator with XRE-family HTH domain